MLQVRYFQAWVESATVPVGEGSEGEDSELDEWGPESGTPTPTPPHVAPTRARSVPGAAKLTTVAEASREGRASTPSDLAPTLGPFDASSSGLSFGLGNMAIRGAEQLLSAPRRGGGRQQRQQQQEEDEDKAEASASDAVFQTAWGSQELSDPEPSGSERNGTATTASGSANFAFERSHAGGGGTQPSLRSLSRRSKAQLSRLQQLLYIQVRSRSCTAELHTAAHAVAVGLTPCA